MKWYNWLISLTLILLLLVSGIQSANAITDLNTIHYYNFETNTSLLDSLYTSNGSVINTSLTNGSYLNGYRINAGANVIVPNFNYSNTSGTISFWFNQTTSGNQQLFDDNSSANNTINIQIFSNKIYASVGGDAFAQSGAIASNTWYNAVFVWNSTAYTLYLNGGSPVTITSSRTPGTALKGFFVGQTKTLTTRFVGVIDEVGVFNKALNSSEVAELYNRSLTYPYGSPVVITSIVFNSQSPSDITTTNLFGTRLNITYNVTDNSANLSTIKLNYTLPNNEYINGTIYSSNYYEVYTQNNSNISYSWLLNDNKVYPGTYNYNETIMENSPHNYIFESNSNNLWKIELKNVNNTKSYNQFEIMLNSTGNTEIYYCNSTYTTGNLGTNNNCILLSIFNSATFNHTHNNSFHNIISLPINTTSGKIGNVLVTPTSWFAIKLLGATNINIGYINNSSRDNAFQRSTTNGGSWTSNNSITIDAHLHQYNVGDSFNYYACFTNSTLNTTCTSTISDTYDLISMPPTSPQIQYPNNNTISGNGVNTLINYTPSITFNPLYVIVYYNISLLNDDLSFNKTINITNSTNFNWITNVSSPGYYYVKVESKDNLNQTNFDISSSFYVYDQHLNLSAKNNLTNTAVNTFSVSSSDVGWVNYTSLSTTTGVVGIFSNKNTISVFTLDSSGYALSNYTFNSNVSDNNYTYQLYPTNSVYITIVDQLTGVLINTNTTIVTMRSDIYNNVTNSSYGRSNWSNLPVGDYTIELVSPGYADGNYQIVVYDRSTQQITARLLPNTSFINVGVYVKSEIYQPLTNALISVQRQYIGGSWATTNQIYTDGNGFAYIPVQEGEIYRFLISASGYNTKQFDMPLFSVLSPYTFVLTQTSSTLYTNYYEGVNYYYSPVVTQINSSFNNFSITTYNSTLDISWTSVNINGSITNVSGSPSGSTATGIVNLSGFCGKLPVVYSFYFYNTDLGEYLLYSIPVNYYVNCYSITQTSVPDVWDDFSGDVDSDVWSTIISMMIILTIVITLIQLSGNQSLGIVGGVVGLAFFGYVGMISPVFAIISGLLAGIMLFLNRG